MQLPETLELIDGAYAMDGGTISLSLEAPNGTRHQVLLTQHRLPPSPGQLPRGRLFLDRQAIDVRSQTECQLLLLLRNAPIRSAGAASERPETTVRRP